MPNRYEREIEEILRNLEAPKAGAGQRFAERARRRPTMPKHPRPRNSFSLRFTIAEWLLFITVVAALIAGGVAYAQGEATLFTGIVAVFGIISLVVVTLSHFIFRPLPPKSTRFNNIQPMRRGPFDALRTRWKLFMLKMRYPNDREQDRR